MTAPASTPAHRPTPRCSASPATSTAPARPRPPSSAACASSASQPVRLQPARPVRQGAQGRHRLPHRRQPPDRRGRPGQAALAPAVPGARRRRDHLPALARRPGRRRPGPDPRRARHARPPARQDQPPLRPALRRRPRRGRPAALRRGPAQRGGGHRHPAPDGPPHGPGPARTPSRSWSTSAAARPTAIARAGKPGDVERWLAGEAAAFPAMWATAA